MTGTPYLPFLGDGVWEISDKSSSWEHKQTLMNMMNTFVFLHGTCLTGCCIDTIFKFSPYPAYPCKVPIVCIFSHAYLPFTISKPAMKLAANDKTFIEESPAPFFITQFNLRDSNF